MTARKARASIKGGGVDDFPLLPADHCLHVAAWHLARARAFDQAADECRAMALFAEADAQEPPSARHDADASATNDAMLLPYFAILKRIWPRHRIGDEAEAYAAFAAAVRASGDVNIVINEAIRILVVALTRIEPDQPRNTGRQ